MVFKVTFHIENEITFKEPPRIDAIIQSIYFKNFPSTEVKDDVPIPIRRINFDDTWIYDCSFAEYQIESKELDNINKQINPYGLNKNKLTIGSGKYCSNVQIFERYTIKSLSYYVGSDNINFLEQDLKCITNIGGLRKCNFGKVGKIEIKTTDREFAWKHDGVTLRDIPCSENIAFDLMLTGGVLLRNACIRPPYNQEYGTKQRFVIMPPYKIFSTKRLLY